MNDDLLDDFLAATAGGDTESIPLRALTLHMLQHLAPTLFARRGLTIALKEALERCADVPMVLTGSGGELEEGLDCWYLRTIRGLEAPAPNREKLAEALRRINDDGEGLYAWLLGEMAARAGVDVRVPFGERPFRDEQTQDAYFLTHEVMLQSDYFAKKIRVFDASPLIALVPWLEEEPDADLIGEVAACLKFLGADTTAVMKLVAQAEAFDAHSTATLLLAQSAE